jgi:hypothetical protein
MRCHGPACLTCAGEQSKVCHTVEQKNNRAPLAEQLFLCALTGSRSRRKHHVCRSGIFLSIAQAGCCCSGVHLIRL